jgi:hypothetical protein
MKLSRDRIRHIADSLVAALEADGALELEGPRQTLADSLNQTITEELSVEDRLNAEVRALMKNYQTEIERGNVDYQKMFTLIKKKLVQERGLIL